MKKYLAGRMMSSRGKMPLLIIAVLTVAVQPTQAQSYSLSSLKVLGLNPASYLTTEEGHLTPNQTFFLNEQQEKEDNITTTVVVIENTARDKPTELSQTAMDIITIVWYVATFLALAAFFMLMACSDRRCNQAARLNAQNGANGADASTATMTPSPSYSQFAPPSYETVMKMQHPDKTSIFVIPFTYEQKEDEATQGTTIPTTPTTPVPSGNNTNQTNNSNNNNDSNNNNSNTNNDGSQPPTPAVIFYTINEMQKLGT